MGADAISVIIFCNFFLTYPHILMTEKQTNKQINSHKNIWSVKNLKKLHCFSCNYILCSESLCNSEFRSVLNLFSCSLKEQDQEFHQGWRWWKEATSLSTNWKGEGSRKIILWERRETGEDDKQRSVWGEISRERKHQQQQSKIFLQVLCKWW